MAKRLTIRESVSDECREIHEGRPAHRSIRRMVMIDDREDHLRDPNGIDRVREWLANLPAHMKAFYEELRRRDPRSKNREDA